jgi:hypothetical protein
MSGSDASFVPRRNLQVAPIDETVLVMEIEAACATTVQHRNASETSRVVIGGI